MALGSTILLVSLVFLAVSLSLAFARHRLLQIKDMMMRLWSPRRQEVLHLQALNGFDVLRERLHLWSSHIALAAAAALFLVFIWDIDRFPLAGAMVAGAFAYRHFARHHITSSLARQVNLPLEYDGFGSYARARSDWKREAAESKKQGFRATVIAVSFVLMGICGWL